VGTEKRERQKANRAQKQQQAVQSAKRRTTARYIAIGVGAVAVVFVIAWIASIVSGDDDEPTTPITIPATIVPDTLVPETLVPETLVPDTLVPDTLVPDTLAPTSVGG
jgi:hypothetical protein